MIHIRSTIAALLVMGVAAAASAQQPAPVAATQGQHAAHARAGHPRAKLQKQLFHGIALSAAEKTNVKSVEAKYETQLKALRQQNKPQLDAMRAARQRGDSAALRSMLANTSAQRQQTKQLLQAERNDLRAALTPQNQAKFDANAAALGKRVHQRTDGAGKNSVRSRGL